MIRRPPRSTPLPYTTLFRSRRNQLTPHSRGRPLARCAQWAIGVHRGALRDCERTRSIDVRRGMNLTAIDDLDQAILKPETPYRVRVVDMPHFPLSQNLGRSRTFPALSIPFFPFFNDTATTEIYTLALHDALPI